MRTSIKNILSKGLDILVAVLAVVALSYEISGYSPSELVVIFELEKLEMPFTYSLTGADSDQDYLLEYVKIRSNFDYPAKLITL